MKGKGRILLAEDNELFGVTLERLLRHHDYECVRVSDVNGAVVALREREFDLLISDIHMPGDDGMALVQHLRDAAPDLPIILMTGYPTLDTAIRSVGRSVVGYLVKPPNPAELFSLIEREIGTRRRIRSFRAREADVRECLQELRSIQAEEGGLQEPDRAGVATVIQRLEVALTAFEDERATEFAARMAPTTDSGSPTDLQAVVRDVIRVLEATRRQFKSRDLGQLRRRLEALIEPATRSEPSAEGEGGPKA